MLDVLGPTLTLDLRLNVNRLISDRADCSELLGHAGPLRVGTASRPVHCTCNIARHALR